MILNSPENKKHKIHSCVSVCALFFAIQHGDGESDGGWGGRGEGEREGEA